MRSWTRQAVDGNIMSGVTVHTITASISLPEIPRWASTARGRFHGHVGRGDAGRGDVPFRDSGSL
jgi:hypothetical protein